MSKFAVFTMILSISVITITADLLIHKYIAEAGQTSVLGGAQNSPVLDDGTTSDPFTPEVPKYNTSDKTQVDSTETTTPPATTTLPTPPTTPVVKAPSKPVVTNEMVKQAGFTGTLQEKLFLGKLYQLLDISQFPVQSIGNYQLNENGVAAITITEITLPDEIQALSLYSLLQNKTKTYIDLSLNQTNAYGDRSFYINHSKKKDEAFLTVKIKNRLYGFAYVKFYHPEVQKLLLLLAAAQ